MTFMYNPNPPGLTPMYMYIHVFLRFCYETIDFTKNRFWIDALYMTREKRERET